MKGKMVIAPDWKARCAEHCGTIGKRDATIAELEAQLAAALATIARVQDAVDCAPLDNEAAGVFAHILKGGKVRWVEVMYD